MPAISVATLPLLLLPLIIPAVIAYFAQIRPKRRREREAAALQQALRVGDRVVTISGLHGTVAGLTPTTVELKACPNSVHRYDRTSVIRLAQS
jgi:preprotein translocase subunit YajC